MKKQQRVTVRCPECDSDLTIDVVTGQVVFHAKQQTAVADKDFDRLLEGINDSKARANEIFESEMAALEDRERLLEEKFQEAVRRSEREPDQHPPLRPWDLD